MRKRPSTGCLRPPKPEVSRAYGIGMRMNGRLSERPSGVKYSGLPLRMCRNALCELAVHGEGRSQHRAGIDQLPILPGLVDHHAETIVLIQVGVEVDVVLEHLVGQLVELLAAQANRARGLEQRGADLAAQHDRARGDFMCDLTLAQRIAVELQFDRLAIDAVLAHVDAHRAHAAVGRQVEAHFGAWAHAPQHRLDLGVLHHVMQLALRDSQARQTRR